jgi:protein involved in polysaccharide export with SLBB domain
MTSTDMFKTDANFAFDNVNNKIKEIRIQPGDIVTIRMTTNNGLSILETNALGYSALNPQIGSPVTPTQNMIQPITQTSTILGTQIAVRGGNRADSSVGMTIGQGYLVDFDSTIKMPTMGRIKIAGYTLREAEAYFEKKFADNYQKPFVSVKVINRKIYMFFTQATHAITLPLTEEKMTIVDAIAKIGGVPAYSKAYNIKIIRGDRLNPKVFNFNLRTLTDYKNNNLLLEADDIVYVDSRPQYVKKTMDEMQPWLLLITTSMLFFTFYKTYL